jgi:hypothetical protein
MPNKKQPLSNNIFSAISDMRSDEDRILLSAIAEKMLNVVSNTIRSLNWEFHYSSHDARGGHSWTGVVRSMRNLERSLRYLYFRRCHEDCCSDDTIALTCEIDRKGGIRGVVIDSARSRFADTVLCIRVIEELDRWTFGKKDMKYSVHLRKRYRGKRTKLGLVFYFREPSMIRFLEPILDKVE